MVIKKGHRKVKMRWRKYTSQTLQGGSPDTTGFSLKIILKGRQTPREPIWDKLSNMTFRSVYQLDNRLLRYYDVVNITKTKTTLVPIQLYVLTIF